MAELSLQKLRPLIHNDRCFRRRDVAGAVMRLWYTREQKEADIIASDLIQIALRKGIIRRIPSFKNLTWGAIAYEYVDSSNEEARSEIIRRHLKQGVVITHTRCMGCIEEHEFSGWDGPWICGVPTKDTFKLSGSKGRRSDHSTNDIAPANVTHIDRVPIEALDSFAKNNQQRPQGQEKGDEY